MAGTGFSVTIRPLKKRTYMTPRQLQDWIWRELYKHIRPIANRKASLDVIRRYLRDEAADGLAGRWDCSENQLSFTFMDAAGCCSMSAEVGFHWCLMTYKVRFADLEFRARGFDWALSDLSRSLEEILSDVSYPIIELNEKLYCIAPPESGQPDAAVELFTDGGERLSWTDLSPAQRKRVAVAARNRECLCQLCKAYRPPAGNK